MAVEWRSWADGIREARRSKKPILLSISARWCHWCHTMDRLSWSQREIGRAVHRSFVPIRVDADQRPDIDVRYNLGGWPTTAILSRGADLIAGATYIPPESLPQFLAQGLRHVRAFKRPKTAAGRSQGAMPSLSLKDARKTILEGVLASVDPANGGFGAAPKFPHPEVLSWLSALLRRHKDAALQKTYLRALEAMAHGELHDHAGGGFFRYCLNANWTMPHFEKMLGENAALADAYITAYGLTHHRRWRSVAEGVFRFIDTMLYDPSVGLYRGSQEADEEFCKLPLHARLKAKRPAIDPHCYTDSNARLVSAFLHASKAFRDPSLREKGLRMLKTLIDTAAGPSGAQHFAGDSAPVLLQDTAQLAVALADAYALTHDDRWRTEAKKIIKASMRAFPADGGGWADRVHHPSDAGRLKWLIVPVSENSLMASAALRIDTAASQRVFARRALESIAPQARAYPLGAASFGLAVDLL